MAEFMFVGHCKGIGYLIMTSLDFFNGLKTRLIQKSKLKKKWEEKHIVYFNNTFFL